MPNKPCPILAVILTYTQHRPLILEAVFLRSSGLCFFFSCVCVIVSRNYYFDILLLVNSIHLAMSLLCFWISIRGILGKGPVYPLGKPVVSLLAAGSVRIVPTSAISTLAPTKDTPKLFSARIACYSLIFISHAVSPQRTICNRTPANLCTIPTAAIQTLEPDCLASCDSLLHACSSINPLSAAPPPSASFLVPGLIFCHCCRNSKAGTFP